MEPRALLVASPLRVFFNVDQAHVSHGHAPTFFDTCSASATTFYILLCPRVALFLISCRCASRRSLSSTIISWRIGPSNVCAPLPPGTFRHCLLSSDFKCAAETGFRRAPISRFFRSRTPESLHRTPQCFVLLCQNGTSLRARHMTTPNRCSAHDENVQKHSDMHAPQGGACTVPNMVSPIRIQRRTARQIVDVPVPKVVKEHVEITKVFSQNRVQPRLEEQTEQHYQIARKRPQVYLERLQHTSVNETSLNTQTSGSET